MANSINIDVLNGLLSTGGETTLLDVRCRTDYEANPQVIPGASWRDPEKIDTWLKQLPAGNRTVVYCVKGGSVSQSVTERLRLEGLNAVYIEGGLKNWVDNGNPVETLDSSPSHHKSN